MINFYNEKLAPEMLCKLLHDVVPYRFHRPVIFSYGHKHMPESANNCKGITDLRYVWMNLQATASAARVYASISANTWHEMLRVGFHEFGHIALPHGNAGRYKHDRDYHRHIEDQADVMAKRWIAKILANDGRLYQPDFLGVVDIVRWQKEKPFKEMPKHGKYYNWRLNDIRCYKCGGQLTIKDVVDKLFGRYPCNLLKSPELNEIKKKIDAIKNKYEFEKFGYLDYGKLSQEDRKKLFELDKKKHELEEKEWKLRIKLYEREKKRKFRPIIHKYGDDLARIYTDHAGRRHHFWVWGDLPIIAQRVAENRKAGGATNPQAD